MSSKTCKTCNIEKDESEYYKYKNTYCRRDHSYKECKKCYNLRVKKYCENNKEKKRKSSKIWWENNKTSRNIIRKEQRLKRNYDLSLIDRENILKEQDYKCKSCNTDLKNLISYHIHIDHDHTTNVIRGILCRGCNIALGLLNDDPDKILKLYNYLKPFK
ncbi:MAG: endonuclease VII domain-containing protein [Candidatus Omnitrophica bacterium]|jgi:hypothetical protein|nr:endonuclease VII domain-containing protein [Candidatus Omnitrophota bacterium]